MDYPVLDRNPDVAPAFVPHALDGNGNAAPQSAGTPGPVATPGTLRPSATPAVTSGSAYAGGNVVGGLLTFAGAVRAAGLGGVLQTALLRDKSGNNVPYDLFLFDGAPSTPADKTAVALSAADLAKCVGVVPLTGASLGAASTMAVIVAPGVALAFRLASGTTLYGTLVTRAAPTYSGTSDVSVDLVILPD